MRGRKSHDMILASDDVAVLQHIARSRTLPWFQVQRARIVLAVAAGERVQTVAEHRKLTAQEQLVERIDAYYGCEQFDHLLQKVA